MYISKSFMMKGLFSFEFRNKFWYCVTFNKFDQLTPKLVGFT